MTSHQRRPRAAIARNSDDHVKLAPWGWYTRHMLWIYIQHIVIVVAALLSISLTTDIAMWVWREISAQPSAEWWALTFRIGWIVVLRTADLLPQVTPIAFFLGVLWAETVHTWTRERLVVWNTGRSPAQCVIPVLLLSACMTLMQFVFDAQWRPAAVLAMENRDLSSTPTHQSIFSREKTFIVAGDDLVQARVAAGTPPKLYDVTIYRLTQKGRLRQIVSAASASPGSGKSIWQLNNGRVWTMEDDNVAATPAHAGGIGPMGQRILRSR